MEKSPTVFAVDDDLAILDALGCVNILKRTGTTTPRDGPIANANSFPEGIWDKMSVEERDQIWQTLDEVNWNFIFVTDPDGNIVEIQPGSQR